MTDHGKLTALQKAFRTNLAHMRSEWEHDAADAIFAAIGGDISRLVDMLRAGRLAGAVDDQDALADRLVDFYAYRHGTQQGAPPDEGVRAARVVADSLAIKDGQPRSKKIEEAVEAHERLTGERVSAEKVRTLRRPRKRLQKQKR